MKRDELVDEPCPDQGFQPMSPARGGRRTLGLQRIAAGLQINRLLRKWMAVEIRRYSDISRDLTRLVGSEAAVIVDIGANTGQSAALFSRLFPQATILAIEPFDASYKAIMARGVQRVHPHLLAMGARNGTAVLHVNSQSVTNSLLIASPEGQRLFPKHMDPISNVKVEMITLDSFAAREGLDRIDLLKIDVQGTELEVLRGGHSILPRVHVIQIECNFIPIYENSSVFSEVDIVLRRAGFEFYNFYGLHQDPVSRRLVFGDALFVRKTNAAGPRNG